MSQRYRVGIAGTGSSMPSRIVDNNWFAAQGVDTSDEWIVQRTGIKSRRFAAEGEATSTFCIEAARKALEAAKLEATELDLILVATVSPDHMLPACALLVQQAIGATKAAAYDLNAACSGFLTALTTGEAFIAAGTARNVLVIGAETLSRFLDIQDRGSCILFGDGAGAAVLRRFDDCQQGEILRRTLGADGSGYGLIHMKGGGAANPPTHASVDRGDHYIRVQGREVFKFAVSTMGELIAEMTEGHSYDEIGLVVPHQVNLRIIDACLERMGWNSDKVMINIDKYGNTSAASVPVALDEGVRAGRVEKGKLVVLVAFGAGLTWGGALIRW